MKGVPCSKAESVRIVRAADETLIYQNLKNIDDTSSMDIDTSLVRRQEQHSLSSLSKHVNKVAAAREAVRSIFSQLTSCISAETASLPFSEIQICGLESEQIWAQTDIQIGILLGNAKRSISHMRGLLYVPEVILEQERRFRAEKVAADLTECEYTATGCPHADQLERLDHSLQLETEVKSPGRSMLSMWNLERPVMDYQETAQSNGTRIANSVHPQIERDNNDARSKSLQVCSTPAFLEGNDYERKVTDEPKEIHSGRGEHLRADVEEKFFGNKSTRQRREDESPGPTSKLKHGLGESMRKSAFQKEQEKLAGQIRQLEESAVGEKPWLLRGEANAKERPKNSALSVEMDFDRTHRPSPDVNEIITAKLEEIIKLRIADNIFDDEENFKPVTGNHAKQLDFSSVEDTRSSKGLADIYEDEYLRAKQLAKTGNHEAVERTSAQTDDIYVLFRSLSSKLDALCSFQAAQKIDADNVPLSIGGAALKIEEVTSQMMSHASKRGPEEVLNIGFGKGETGRKAAGETRADGELTNVQKKARRAKKKRKHKLHGIDQERLKRKITLPTEAKAAASHKAGFRLPTSRVQHSVSCRRSKSEYSQSSKFFSILQDGR
mmetsp:Transcript_11021/g.44388  ORF Transcript_11021/g.44388 Transcript_11021/m.44388 type:complete len:609 (+) Transcript_11021:112-1938(+)